MTVDMIVAFADTRSFARPDAEIEAEIGTDVLGRYPPSVPLATHLVRRVYGVVDVVNDIATRPRPGRSAVT